MFDEKVIKILKRVYYGVEGEYDYNKKLYVYKLPDNLKQNEEQVVQDSGYKINNINLYTHDNFVRELRALVGASELESMVHKLFLKAIGTGWHRGLQPIVSYYYGVNMPDHVFEPFEDARYSNQCKVCGLPKDSWENDGKNLYDLYIGYCRVIGGYFETLLDLQEVMTFDDVEVSEADLAVFKSLIGAIENAGKGDTATDLLSKLSKDKVLPKSNTTSRTWLIRVLAVLGVLKNSLIDDFSVLNGFTPYSQIRDWELELHAAAPNHRMEVNFPISAWRGELGVNQVFVRELLKRAKID